jgi:phage baseplate assembly protein W
MGVEFQPETVEVEIAQNVRVILATVRGTQPLDRQLGIAAELVDAPVTRARALLVAEITDALPRQEPRIDVTRVTLSADASGSVVTPGVEYRVIV